jgi:hypothetical protein
VNVGEWYKFVVGITNTSGATGNLAAGCALFDYGTNGLTPGTNLINFSTAVSHLARNIATNTAVWPALRAFEDAGISAWDNFLVYQSNSLPLFTLPLTNLTMLAGSMVTFTALGDGPGPISYAWYTNNALVPGISSYSYTPPPLAGALTNVTVVVSNPNGSATNQSTVTVITPMGPLVLTGFNRDVVIPSNAIGPPYGADTQEYNPGEGTCYYQHGLPGTTYGLPAQNVFNSVIDMTQFEFQPYTANNALVMSSETGVSSGTLTLFNPAAYARIAILANSASAEPTSTGALTLNFADGSTMATNFDAADWFFNPGFALQGVDRINIETGATDGGPTDPRFYQTTIDLAAAGAAGKTLTSLKFGKASGVGATAVYAVSGLINRPNPYALATVTNSAVTQIQGASALLGGGIASTGGYVPSVTIFYGPADGGTDPAAWSNSVAVGYASGAFSQTVANLLPGVTYYVSAQANNTAGSAWARPPQTFTTPVVPVAGTPTAAPSSSVPAGTTVTLTVPVSGAPPFQYQWQTNDVDIPGATNSSLVLRSATVAESGSYDVLVTNGFGSSQSPPLVLTVTAAPPPTAIGFLGNAGNWTINTSGTFTTAPNITSNVLSCTDGGADEWVDAWYNNLVFVNGFTVSFTYQNPGDVGDSDADGASFTLQESGPTFITTENGGSGLGIQGLTPSANWEIDIYSGHQIGTAFNMNGTTETYFSTGKINVASGDPINFTIQYMLGGAVLETLVDTVTQDSFTTNYNIGDLTALLGTSFAYVGVTASSGGIGGVQKFSNFIFQGGSNNITPAVVTNLPATAIEPEAVTLSGEVLTNGGEAPTITIYYGPADGGTNAAAWSDSITLGVETGTFSQTITGLAPDTTYYFTVYANNFAGASWASPSLSFTTTTVTLPQVANAPATDIGATLATLNGQVLSTGGAPTSVILYYGPTDGGANAAGWSNSVPLGLESGAFAESVASLSSNTTYYFTAEATNSAGAAWATPSLGFTTLASNPVSTLTAVLTYHNDNTRWGVNSNETILTLANVNTNDFGKLFDCAVDGFVYAQPLIMTNVSISGLGTHNVVFVATEHDSVYAFDADNNTGPNASPLWHTSFLGPGVTTVPASELSTSDITPEIGITSTPVIDPVTGTIYLEVKTLEQGVNFVHRLHALDITTGLERADFKSPAVISCTNYPGSGTGDNDGKNPPHVLWNPLLEHSRPALTLLNGAIYMSFASHGDIQPYHGWLFAYNATNVSQQLGVYNTTPNGGAGGFWEGGGGPSVDAEGNLYLQSGNGTFDGGTSITTVNDYGMSLMKFSTTNGIALVDFFTPANAVALSDADQDLGSSAPVILPDSAGSAAHPHLVVGGGKTSPVYLVDRDKMGRFNGVNGANKIVQQFNGGPSGDRDVAPAFFNNTLYIIDYNSKIGAYKIANGLFDTTPVESPDSYDNKGGATVSISSEGASNAIAWAIYNTGGESPTADCVLRAYNARTMAKLYSSDELPARDSAGAAVKFTVPTIANGKVYVGGQYSLTVYGVVKSFVNLPVMTPRTQWITSSF